MSDAGFVEYGDFNTLGMLVVVVALVVVVWIFVRDKSNQPKDTIKTNKTT